MVELRNVTKSYSGGWLNQMNYQFKEKGLYGVIGTKEERDVFLKLIGLEDLDFEGSILYHEKNILPHDIHTYMEKNVMNIKNISLEENKSIVGNLKSSKKNEEEIARDLKRFGLEENARKRIKSLSEEEKRTVVLLKAFETKKEIYLLDEQDLKISPKNQKKMMQKIEQLSKKALILIGVSKKRIGYGESIKYLRINCGNLVEETEVENERDIPVKEKSTPHKKVEKEKRITSIAFFALIFFFLFVAMTFQTINKDKIHYETLIHENSQEIYLKLNGNQISESELEEIQKEAQISFGTTYSVIGTFMGLSGKKAVTSSEYPIFYNAIMSVPVFYVVDETNKPDLFLGRLPENEDEIVVTKTVADFILYKGILTTENTFFEPKTYEELIQGAKNVSYGGIPVQIVGITKQELDVAEPFKTKKESELTKEEYYSYQDYSGRNEKYHTTYVTSNFKNYLNSFKSGGKISENLTEIHIITENKKLLQNLIEKYSQGNIEIESIVSSRLNKYSSIFQALKVIGSILTFLFIVCFFLELIYIIAYNIKELHQKEFETQKELFYLLLTGMISGFILYLGYITAINLFVSHKLFIYFHALIIHPLPLGIMAFCTFVIAYCLTKYFYSENK